MLLLLRNEVGKLIRSAIHILVRVIRSREYLQRESALLLPPPLPEHKLYRPYRVGYDVIL